MNSGERYCLLIDSDSDLPLFYPNLYVTTQIRNKSLSYSAMEATLSSISVLISFLDAQNEDIEKRIREGLFFQESELDALKDFCQINFRTSAYTNNLLPFSKKKEHHKKVSSTTEYSRITVIAHYLTWLSAQILGMNQSNLAITQINKLEKTTQTNKNDQKNKNKNSRSEYIKSKLCHQRQLREH